MAKWLPSESTWLNQLSERVLIGDILVVRALPRWGLTSACKELCNILGDSAVFVDGKEFTEDAQTEFRDNIDQSIQRALDETGSAQLIFDNYGTAIRRSQGGHLHSMLYRLLIDGKSAQDIGALLTARSDDMLDIEFSGSPLISRAETVVLPTLGPEDAEAVGENIDLIERTFGQSTWLARRLLQSDNRQAVVAAIEHLNADRHRIVRHLPPDTVKTLIASDSISNINPLAQEILLCFGGLDGTGSYWASKVTESSALVQAVQEQSPGWPPGFSDSIERFAALIGDLDDAIWVDRYLLANPLRARRFLGHLQRKVSIKLRLLVSDDRSKPDFLNEIRVALAGLDDIQVRFMTTRDRHELHDRHLVFPSLRCGVVLPTSGVIFGHDSPGSAVSVPLPRLAINYSECWSRGIRVYP